jgi:hypothetical protein
LIGGESAVTVRQIRMPAIKRINNDTRAEFQHENLMGSKDLRHDA